MVKPFIEQCPKCDRMGYQHHIKNKKYPYRVYLEYIHPKDAKHKRTRCFLGRIASSEYDSKFDETSYKKALRSIIIDLRKLLRQPKISKEDIQVIIYNHAIPELDGM